MRTIILVVSVNFDGMGDFDHFVGVRDALVNNSKYKDYQIISVVCAVFNYKQVEIKLNKLELPNCFLLNSNQSQVLSSDHPLCKHFAEAEQMIEISHDGFPWCVWADHFNPHGQYKFIGEHELATKIKIHAGCEGFFYHPLGVFKDMNLADMVKHWPVVSMHLKTHHNFYHKLDTILSDEPSCDKASRFGL